MRRKGWNTAQSAAIARAVMTDTDKIDQLAAALVAFQAEMPAVPKNSENPFFHSKYADMADVVAAAKPILAKHGLAVSQFVSHDADRNTLVTYLLHSSGQFIKDEMLLMLPKDDPQGQGSATTYARRYAYSAALGIVTDSDDDGTAASASQSRPARSTAPAPRQCVRCEKPLDGPVKPVEGGYAHKECVEGPEENSEAGRGEQVSENASTKARTDAPSSVSEQPTQEKLVKA